MRKLNNFVTERKKRFTRAAAVLFPLMAALLLLSQPVFAETTYVITDGSRVLIHTTTATDPETVLGEVGFELGADDTYTTQAVAGISEINVRRGQLVHIDYFGQSVEASTFGESVGSLLHRLNLTWGPDDVISVPTDTKTYDGMELSVATVVQQEQTYTQAIPYETIYCSDDTLDQGVQEVLTPGVSGEMICTASVTYVNGKESSRTVLSQQVVSQPVNAIVAVGSAPREEQPPVITDSTITLSTGEVLSYTRIKKCTATGYYCKDYEPGITATGTKAQVGTVAVDPRYIPFGTRMFIITEDGSYVYGIATAEDAGHPDYICGNRLDLFFNTKAECVSFGAQPCDVYILG